MTGELELKEPNPTVSLVKGIIFFFNTIFSNWYLINNMVQKTLKGKYSRASIGFGWIYLEPLLLSAVYYVLFTMIADRPEPNYSLYVIVGVIIWSHFGKSLQAVISCLTNNSSLIKQVYFPREILAISPVITQLWISMISLTAVIPVMWYLEVTPGATIWMLPLSLLLATMLAIGIGTILAPINAISQDVSHLFRFIIRAGFFLSPVMWTYEMMLERTPSEWVNLVMLNPMVIPITYARHGLDGTQIEFEILHLLYCLGFCIVSVLVGTAIFKRMESKVVKHL